MPNPNFFTWTAYGSAKNERYIGVERDLQANFKRMMDYYPQFLWCHIANERKTASRKLGGYWTGQGVKSGVPDNLIFNPSRIYKGLAIELKTRLNKPSYPQLDWMQRLENRGWCVCVAYSIIACREILRCYLDNVHPADCVTCSVDHYTANMLEAKKTYLEKKALKPRKA